MGGKKEMRKILENGKYREMTAEELAQLEQEKPPYKERVVARIREKYSVDDEIAILRQEDTKPEEYAEYNAFVEKVKAEER
jgi:hypothetical protein